MVSVWLSAEKTGYLYAANNFYTYTRARPGTTLANVNIDGLKATGRLAFGDNYPTP
jgi:hypothetical protein